MVGLKCLNCSSQEWQEITRGARGAPIDIKGLLPPCSDRGLSVDKINHQINWPVRVWTWIASEGSFGTVFCKQIYRIFWWTTQEHLSAHPMSSWRHEEQHHGLYASVDHLAGCITYFTIKYFLLLWNWNEGKFGWKILVPLWSPFNDCSMKCRWIVVDVLGCRNQSTSLC